MVLDMASQAASPAAVLPSAQVVGNAFVDQYYHILHQSPELVHKFYQDSSILSRPDTNGLMSSVTTMQAIDEKIQSLDYKNVKAEIKTADAQDSHQAGVIVLVTGCLTGKDNVKRKFAQTFFLAPQEKGYFVQNDVFRFVEETAPLETPSTSLENIVDSVPADLAVPNSEATHVSDNNPTYDSPTTLAAEDLNNGPEVCDPEDNEGSGSGLEEEVVDVPEPAPVQTSPNETGSVQKPDSSASQEEKKSYASIVRVTKITGSSGSGHVQTSSLKWAPANTDQLKSRTAKPSPEPEASAPVVVNGPENSKVSDDGHSIYIRNLPMNATVAQLEEEFKKFGPIKSDGVQVRSNKQQGFCFGFVEFVSLDSMHSAIKEPSITIGNRQVVVEEKRTTTRVGGGGGGRGRYPSGRGGGFRGRGGYFGGRSFGRNEFRYQGEFPNRSKGPTGRTSEVYQRVDQNGGGRSTHQPSKDVEPGQ
ncbi:putative Ras GTPase-activating protein-binding protein [Helianthus annuus]|uniref:Ras GTPase-activating protein-binding protein n=3 Tax=Helianthus annuus TaxID=4232 RepID=A0A9K3NPM4_HELAN|nr:putative Ras GTPase-activating protein-binding protein [Helianthus annuus]KAJ0585801.1 putative Ras GTPase-activating protein-binding protein [Helianthus annuus]KAJ0920433.1 putative Ras GTPase-activating protein-binding protein [Helianthus annuus]